MNVDIPKKCYFKFNHKDLQTDGNFHSTYEIAESLLFYYENVNIELPNSILPDSHTWVSDNFYINEEFYHKQHHKSGIQNHFSDEQFDDIRSNGYIEIQSSIFRDKTYKWCTRKCLLKGTENIKEQFKKDVSKSLYLLSISWLNRFYSDSFSLLTSISNIFQSFVQLTDLFIGLPHTNNGDIEKKLEEEMLQFLSCELRVSSETKEELWKYWDHFEHLSCLPKECTIENIKSFIPNFKTLSRNNWQPPGFYSFVTPGHKLIDLRITNHMLQERCRIIVRESINEHSTNQNCAGNNLAWLNTSRLNTIRDMFDNNIQLEHVKNTIEKEEIQRTSVDILRIFKEKCQFYSLPDSIYKVLEDNFKFHFILKLVKDEFIEIVENFKTDMLMKLREKHPILSLVSSWINRQVLRAVTLFIQENQLTPYHMLLDKCNRESLELHEYFIDRIIKFIRTRKLVLNEQLLKNVSFPDNHFLFELEIMIPEFWSIYSVKTGLTEVSYRLETKKILECHTQYPFWRWWLFVCRVIQMMTRFTQIFLIIIPFRSKFSFNAVFCRELFDAKYDVDQETGQLMSYQGEKINTVYSSILDCKSNITNEQSCCSKFINYLLLIYMCLIHPLLCIIISLSSILLAIFVPVWTPIFIALLTFYQIVIFNSDAVSSESRCLPLLSLIICKFFLRGCVSLIFQLILIILLPLLSFVIFLLSLLRAIVAFLFDFIMFHLIIRQVPQIPHDNPTKKSQNTWIYTLDDNKSIHNTPRNIVFQPEHVIILFLYNLELMELKLWKSTLEALVMEPVQNYEKFVESKFGELGLKINWEHRNIQFVMTSQNLRLKTIEDLFEKEYARLNISEVISSLMSSNKCCIKMSNTHLENCLLICEVLTRSFYDQNIKPVFNKFSNITPDLLEKKLELDWWKNNRVEPMKFRDLVVQLFKETFGESIFAQIDLLNEEFFELETHDTTITTFMNILSSKSSLYNKFNNSKELQQFDLISNYNPSKLTVSINYQCKLEQYIHRLKQSFEYPLKIDENQFFFPNISIEIPQPLKSYPPIRRSLFWKWIQNDKDQQNQISTTILRYLNNSLLDKVQLKLFHPLIICLLHHFRDRDNNLLKMSHPLVNYIMSLNIHNQVSSSSPLLKQRPIKVGDCTKNQSDWFSLCGQWNSEQFLSELRRPSHITADSSNYSLDIDNLRFQGNENSGIQVSCHGDNSLATSNDFDAHILSASKRGVSEPLLDNSISQYCTSHGSFPV